MKNFKKLTLVLAVCIIVSILALPVVASTGTKSAELAYRDIKITLNGSTITPKGANGNVVEPFIIDGTTYLPVRAVADALGLYVDWDSNTNTVKLSDEPFKNSGEESTGIILTDGGVYSGSYSKLLLLNYTNTTDSDIVRFDIMFTCYDAYGNELDAYYDYLYCDRKIAAGNKSTEQWNLLGADSTYKVTCCVYKYATDSGEIVEIPEEQLKWYTFTTVR